MSVRVTKFDVAHCRHKDVILMVNQISNNEISLRDISDANVLSTHSSFVCICLTTREEHSPSQPALRRTVPRRVKVLRLAPFAFSRRLCPWYCWEGGIGFDRGMSSRRQEILLELKLVCWCGASRDMSCS